MYRQFRVVVPHWGFSSAGKPDSGGGSYFEVPSLLVGSSEKKKQNFHVMFFQTTIRSAMS